MDKFPVAPKRRRVVERMIRGIDISAYAVILISGVYALFLTPGSVTETLFGWEWIIPCWAGFLIAGGVFGIIGRVTTIWMFEPPADFAAFIGILIYFVVLGHTAFETITAAVAACLVFVAMLGVVRRYLELQLFGSDPTHRDIYKRLEETLDRRIPNVPFRR